MLENILLLETSTNGKNKSFHSWNKDFKQEEFVTVKAALLQDQLKANLQYERLLKKRDEEIRRLKIGIEFLRDENKELKNARYVDLRG